MKIFLVILCFILGGISVVGGYSYYNEKQILAEYNEMVANSAELVFKGNLAEKTAFADQVFEKMQQYPKDMRWKRLYGVIQIDFFKDYPKAIGVMEKIYRHHQDNHLLIGICTLKEKAQLPSQECYETVLDNVEQPYYDDINYWVAVDGLGKDYAVQDIEKSRLPEDAIRFFLTQDRQKFFEKVF